MAKAFPDRARQEKLSFFYRPQVLVAVFTGLSCNQGRVHASKAIVERACDVAEDALNQWPYHIIYLSWKRMLSCVEADS